MLFFFSELKEEAKSRLSGLCTDTPQKEENSCRIASIVNRLEKQNIGIKEEISSLHDRDIILKSKILELKEKCNSEEFSNAIELGELHITNMELKNQVK